MKVFLCPNPETTEKHNGIGRVLHAQWEKLPEYGVEFVTEESKADVVACHTQQFDCKRIDVLHLHGIYWTGDPNSGLYHKWHTKANLGIINATRRALEISVPSDWVGEFVRRDFKKSPVTIPHGIDLDEWQPSARHEDYAFWAKNRPNDVCSPIPMYDLAARLPEAKFISTFMPTGRQLLNNVYTCGVLDPEAMSRYLHLAKMYVATTQETWGITTAEAMACGTPVLGYNWGGTRDIVQHKVTGWLAEPGDIEGLVEGHQYILDHWDELSEACIHASNSLSWNTAMQMYYDLYQRASVENAQETHKVSIVVTNYNYGPYLKDSVGSALEQKTICEVVVVDDGSTDNSLEELKKFEGKIKLIQQENQGVAAARNNGISASTGDYIICLDADDMLRPEYVETLLPFFKADRGLGVAYTGMELKTPEGYRVNQWPPDFKWEIMTQVENPPASCIPCAAMFRKEMWRKAGGYNQIYAPAEDTEFWVRGLAYGYTAQRVTNDALFIYRIHEGSASRTKVYNRIDYWHPWMRDKKYPIGAPSETVPLIRSYSKPIFSIVLDVEHYNTTFVESLLGQTYRNWEFIVIGKAWSFDTRMYPFIKMVTFADEVPEKSKGKILLKASGKIWPPDTLRSILDGLQNGTYKDTIDYNLYEIETKEGVRTMPCGTCGGQVSSDFLQQLKMLTQNEDAAAGIQEAVLQASDAGQVRMKFIGDAYGASTFGAPGITPSGQSYRGGNNPFDKFINADPRDVEWLRNSGFWEVVPPPPPEPNQVVQAPVEVPEKIATLGVVPEVPPDEPKVEVEWKFKKERRHMKKVVAE